MTAGVDFKSEKWGGVWIKCTMSGVTQIQLEIKSTGRRERVKNSRTLPLQNDHALSCIVASAGDSNLNLGASSEKEGADKVSSKGNLDTAGTTNVNTLVPNVEGIRAEQSASKNVIKVKPSGISTVNIPVQQKGFKQESVKSPTKTLLASTGLKQGSSVKNSITVQSVAVKAGTTKSKINNTADSTSDDTQKQEIKHRVAAAVKTSGKDKPLDIVNNVSNKTLVQTPNKDLKSKTETKGKEADNDTDKATDEPVVEINRLKEPLSKGGDDSKMKVSSNEALRQRLLNAIEQRAVLNDTNSGKDGKEVEAKMVTTTEKKITNIEREKILLNQGLKERFTQMKEAKKDTAEQEKKMDFEDDTDGDGKVAIEKDKERHEGLEPGNMIDELQKYLLKRFGPVATNIQDLNNMKSEKVTDTGETDKVAKDEAKEVKSENVDNASESCEKHHFSPPVKIPVDNFIPHPIFFKTSIKKDPGSKLHDQLISELGSVLKKRDGSSDDKKGSTDSGEIKDDRDRASINFPKRRVSAKGNKVLGNKALLASLESQLQRTLGKNKIFQRQRLKVINFDAIEVTEKSDKDPSEVADIKPDASLSPKTGAKLILDSEKSTKVHTDSVNDSKTGDVHKRIETIPTSPSDSGIYSETESSVSRETGNGIETQTNDNDQELFVYAYELPSGRTEGVICSVERRESTRDSFGRPRKYLTCINIVAENSTIQEGKLLLVLWNCYRL